MRFYWQEMFDDVVQIVSDKAGEYREKYETLISLVGFSPEPVILTIRALQPQKVHFLISPETETQLDNIIQRAGLQPSQFQRHFVKSSRTADIYAVIKEIVNNGHETTTAIDITGGKKVMGAGAAIAGAFLNCAMFYVDYEIYSSELRKPKPGTEYLSFLDNPHQVFGDLDEERARALYNEGDFSGAIELWGRLRGRVPDPRPVEIKIDIALAEKEWEDFQFDKAARRMDQAIEKTERFRFLGKHLPRLQKKQHILNTIIGKDAHALILNHYHMARRFRQRGKADFAVMMLYRTLEKCLQTRLLQKYNIDVNNPDLAKHPELPTQYEQFVKAKLGASRPLPHKWGLIAAAAVLLIFKDEVLKGTGLKLLQEQVNHRNNGVLAHGDSFNTTAQFDSMAAMFEPVICRVLNLSAKQELYKRAKELDAIEI